jgi:hypothetical protein
VSASRAILQRLVARMRDLNEGLDCNTRPRGRRVTDLRAGLHAKNTVGGPRRADTSRRQLGARIRGPFFPPMPLEGVFVDREGNVCAMLDSIMSLDIGTRGVGNLYPAARARSAEPLSLAAARMLSSLNEGDCVILVTGSLTRAWVSPTIGETDGPVGVAAIARAISYGFNAIPVVVIDDPLVGPMQQLLKASGQSIVNLEEARRAAAHNRFCSVAVTSGFPVDDADARRASVRMIDEVKPKVLISVERTGMSPRGTYHNMLGHDFSAGRSRIDHLFTAASQARIPTIGVGDGGNEIGMGAITDAVHQHIPHGRTICAALSTDVVLPAGVSNWGCYAIQAALAVLIDDEIVLHTSAMERRLLEAAASAGFVDGRSGKCEPTADGLGREVHAAVVEMMCAAVNGPSIGRSRRASQHAARDHKY